MLTWIIWIVAPIILLGVLIFVHELGHFLACRLVNVKVERFSIGFGPKLLSWKGKETEYQIAAFPLGGYVKPLGEETGEEIAAEDWRRSLPGKSRLARFIVFAAGSVANLLLPIPIFWAILVIGQPALAPVIGTVLPGSPAEAAGFQPGDRVRTINQEEIRTWDELARIIGNNPGRALAVTVDREGKPERVTLVPESREEKNLLGDLVTEGRAGILSSEADPHVGIRPGSTAEAAGLRTGDLVVQVGEAPVDTYREVARETATLLRRGQEITFQLIRDGNPLTVTLRAPSVGREGNGAETLGLFPTTMIIGTVTPDRPAARAGFRPGDRILAIDGNPIPYRYQYWEYLQEHGNTPHDFLIERDGKRITLSVTPEADTDNLASGGMPIYNIGIEFRFDHSTREETFIRLDPFRAVFHSVERTAEFTYLTVRGIIALIMGRIPWKNVGSPILIAQLAAKSAESGILPFLSLLIIISINLGIINLLPIPILDGGQIMLLLVETVTRSPLSPRAREITQKIGLALVLLIIAMAVYNDLLRFLG